MKRKIVTRLAALALAALMFCGCGQKPERVQADGSTASSAAAEPEAGQEDGEEIKQPTAEEIAQAAVEAGRFSCNWFWDSAYVAANPWDEDIPEGDIIYATYVDKYSNYTYKDWPYMRINAPGINSLDDLRALTQQYYTADAAEELLEERGWIEQDGYLYVSSSEIGEMGIVSIEVEVEKVSDEQYAVTIYEYNEYEDEPQANELNYSLVDGCWVFDKALWYDWDLPATVKAAAKPEKDADREQENSPASTAAAAAAIKQPTADEIAQAVMDAGCFAWDWFWDSKYVAKYDLNPWPNEDGSMPAGFEEGDVIYETYDETYSSYENWPFIKVTAPGINSLDDLRTLAQQYFTAEATEEMMDMKRWIERDGHLYISWPDGLGGPGTGLIEVSSEKTGDTSYHVIVYENPDDEDCAIYERNYLYVNGYWVFDDYLVFMGQAPAVAI